MKQASRPYRNQRLARPKQRQQHLLEVSIRADKERQRRVRRLAALTFKLLLLGCLGVGAWYGTKQAMRRLVWENRHFFLSDLRVNTDGVLTREQILTVSGLVEGRNIFLYDLGKTRKVLDDLPQVERVEVVRSLPNRIDIEITERQPIAWLAAPGEADPTSSERARLIDARGFVMRSRKILPEYYSLPVITGFDLGNIDDMKRQVTVYEVQAALELLRMNADSTRWQVRSIDISKGYCLVVTDNTHARIVFSTDHISKDLNRLYQILGTIEAKDPEHRDKIRTVNLFVGRNTPVTFGEPVADPAPSPSPSPAAAPAPTGKPGADATEITETKEKDKEKSPKEKVSGSSSTPKVKRAEPAAPKHKEKEKERDKEKARPQPQPQQPAPQTPAFEGLRKPFHL